MYSSTQATTQALFSQGDLTAFLQVRKQAIQDAVDALPEDYIRNVNVQELSEALIGKHQLHVPHLSPKTDWVQEAPQTIKVSVRESQYFAQLYTNMPADTKIDGQRIAVVIPFTGDAELFNYKTRLIATVQLRGRVKEQELHLIFEGAPINPNMMTNELDSTVRSIQESLKWVQNDVSQYNAQIANIVSGQVSNRRQGIQQRTQLSDSLGLPVRVRATPPPAVPTIRKKIELPKVTAANNAEPSLQMEIYEHILKVCSDMAKVMELSPSAFTGIREEDLRYHFLVQLNGWFEGGATGETFNLAGKTDIIIKLSGANAFIGECKYWEGEKAFSDAIDQLLNYVSWRDTKTAIILFNKNKNFTQVLTKMHSVVLQHTKFIKEIKLTNQEQTMRRYEFANNDDQDKHFLLTTLAFNVPS